MLYLIRLLRAALDKSGEPYVLQASKVPMVQDRSLREIAAGHLVDELLYGKKLEPGNGVPKE